jgi:NADH dehydrogenase
VVWGWWNNLWLGRDLVNLQAVQDPRYVFEEFAARPRPPQPVEAAPAKVVAAAPAEKVAATS